MRKKSGSKSKFIKIVPPASAAALHFLSSRKGLYKCSKSDCDGRLDITFTCNKCGQRSIPKMKSS